MPSTPNPSPNPPFSPPHLRIPLHPLTPPLFTPYGTLLLNPSLPPHSLNPPYPPPTPANSSTALRHPTPLAHTSTYPRTSPAPTLQTSIFACQPRALPPDSLLRVEKMERHPYTTQTFIPLGAGREGKYLVVVAPGMQGGDGPDMRRAEAFVGDGAVGVGYGVGVWHAPMIVLRGAGHRGSGRRAEKEEKEGEGEGEGIGGTLDFVVVQWMNGVQGEDCEERDVGEEGAWVEVEVGGY